MINHNLVLWLGVALGAAGLTRGEAVAGPVAFTWDPFQATPALTTGPAAFSADAILVTNYIRNTLTKNLTTRRQTFVGDQIQTIGGFTLGGAAVKSPPGFNSEYGLYFRITPGGSFPLNESGAVIGPPVYSRLDVQLVADVGRDDGSVVDDSDGLSFSTPAGLSNDVVLGTGSLLSASMSMTSDGWRHAHYLTTFEPVAAEAGFFAGTSSGLDLEIFLNTAPSAFQAIPVDSLTVLNVVGADGNSTGAAQLVPEPASLALFAVGLFGLAGSRRFKRQEDLSPVRRIAIGTC